MNSATNSIKAAFIDLDGTLIKGQSQALFIKFLKDKNFIGKFQSYLILFWFILYKIGMTKKPYKILTYALSCFKGKPVKEIYSYIDEFIVNIVRSHYYKDVPLFLDDLRSKNIKLIILSTSVDILVEKIAQDLNIKSYLATSVEIINGTFTGKIRGEHNYGVRKINRIMEYISRENIKMSNVIVFADNYSDKEMLAQAGKGIVVNPDRGMKEWALQNNLHMIYLDRYEPVQYI